MASQPLETIPEEPTPAPTPTPARVTADPPQTKPAKHPGRVASGKRLAEQNRRAREALKKVEAEAAATAAQKQAEAEAASPAPATTTDSESDTTASNTEEASGSSGLSLVTALGIGGLSVAALGVYYQREAITARLKPAPPAQSAQPAEPAPSRIPVKRGIKKME